MIPIIDNNVDTLPLHNNPVEVAIYSFEYAKEAFKYITQDVIFICLAPDFTYAKCLNLGEIEQFFNKYK